MNRILITGASRGIGRATAHRLGISMACQMGLVGRRRPPMDETARTLHDAGSRCEVFVGDVRHPQACRAIARKFFAEDEDFEANEPFTDVLVNAAGVASFGGFADMASEAVEEQIAVNLVGALNMCQAVIPGMVRRGRGTIINVGSMAAVNTLPGSVAYTASKAGLHAASKVMSAEYRRSGMRVISLLVGAVDTELWDGMAFTPPREDMLSPVAVADVISELIYMPMDRFVDEMLLMPPKGIL